MKPPTATRFCVKPDARRGSVLVVVLVVCLGLISMTLAFNHAMLMAYRGEDNDLAGREAEAAILAGEQYAESIIANASPANVLPDRSTYQSAAVPVGDEAFFWFIGQPLASDPAGVPAFALGDEAGRINLNAAPPDLLAILPNMTLPYAQAIVDWRSAPGTTNSVSLQTNPVKHAPFESPDELALVNGGTDSSALCGDDANLNHCLDPEEGGMGTASAGMGTAGGGGAPGQFNPGLLEYVTTFSREPNTLPDGTRRVNVRAPRPGELGAALTAALSAGAGGTAAKSATGGSAVPARVQAILRQATSGQRFAFLSVVEFCQLGRMTPDEWDKVAPYLTLDSGLYTVGLVNVNTASQAVLACLPGMTDSLAAKLVTARAQQTAPATNLAWIVPVLGDTVAGQAGRWLTTRSYQFRADVAAVGRHGRGYRRTLFILDTSQNAPAGGPPQIVYRRNLSGLGWAIGADTRASLLTARTGGLP